MTEAATASETEETYSPETQERLAQVYRLLIDLARTRKSALDERKQPARTAHRSLRSK